MAKNISISLVYIVIFYYTVHCQSNDPVVRTASGRIRGKTVTILGKSVNEFLGIPYAQPPLGKLRFKPSLEVKPWNGILNATITPQSCVQKEIRFLKHFEDFRQFHMENNFSEDCLKLNVWTPSNVTNKTSVLVFIHGGGFSGGGISTSVFNGSVLSAAEGVTCVTINYRLGSLGFLFLDHEDVPGNAGLYDQNMALQWIKKNIEYFGGDSELITLFGHSSGAASVGYHLMTPMSRGLFQRAIMQSGSPNSVWAHVSKNKAIENSIFLVNNLGCSENTDNISLIIQCLQTSSAEDIVQNERYIAHFPGLVYVPVEDGNIVLEHPTTLVKNYNFPSIPLITGSIPNEASVVLILLDPIHYNVGRDNITVGLQDLVEDFSFFTEVNPLLFNFTTFLYLNEVHSVLPAIKSWKYADFGIQSSSDIAIHCPVNEFVLNYKRSSVNNVFTYFFNHHTSYLAIPQWMGMLHSEELLYVFGDPLQHPEKYTSEEKLLSRTVMRYWSNFARTGNPNKAEDGEKDPIFWAPFTAEEKEFLVLSQNTTRIEKAFREKYCIFWNKLMPKLQQLVSQNNCEEE